MTASGPPAPPATPTPPVRPAKRGPAGRGHRPLGSTYRLQLHGLGLAGARRLVGYLDDLGVETLYLSPVLEAAPGSTHGYDVVDPTRLDPALGTPGDLEALLAELDAHGMRLLLDVVPNHMAASPANRWWWDVLRVGRRSPHAPTFDIDWRAGGGRVLVGTLGRPLAEALAAGELRVMVEDGEPAVAYFEQRFPLDPDSYTGQPEALAADCADPAVLAELLERQHYRLAYWRVAPWEGNYRRFFDIETLVGVRVEEPSVYAATHRYLLELVDDPRLAGLRVDHVDGLADPADYLARLRADLDRRRDDRPALLVEKILARGEELPEGWAADGTTGYEFADLAGGVLIDPSGAAALRGPGPAGDADALVLEAKREVQRRLFPGQLARLAEQAVAAAEQRLGGAAGGLDLAVAEMAAALVELSARLDVYRTYLDRHGASAEDRRRLRPAADLAAPALGPEAARALGLLVEGLADEGGAPGGRRTRAGGAVGGGELEGATWLAVARRWQQHTGAVAAKGVEDTALYRFDGLQAAAEVGGDPGDPAVTVEAFHEAMARRARRHPRALNATTTHDTKRSEDVRSRLAVLSEVPARWAEQLERWHDRYRDLLGDQLDGRDERFVFQTLLGAWPLERGERRRLVPRMQEYLQKAAREAKRRTTWTEPHAAYERALHRFVGRVLAPGDGRLAEDLDRWVADIGPAGAANALALSVLKATAPGVPDVYQGTEEWALTLVDPDNRRPVDFDRRRRHLDALDPMTTAKPGDEAPGAPGGSGWSALAEETASAWQDGRVKLLVTTALLRLRRSEPALFDRGGYLPLEVRGERRQHLVAFARRYRRRWALALVPRLGYQLAGPGTMPVGAERWAGTTVRLPEGAPSRFTDVLTGAPRAARRGALGAGGAMSVLPVSVLVGDAGD